jgi:hypothetical protein
VVAAPSTRPAATLSSLADAPATTAAGEPPGAEPPAPESPPAEPAPPEALPPAAAPATTAPTPPALPASNCAPDAAQLPPAAAPRSVLWQRQASGGGAPFTHSELAAIVVAICPSTAQLMLSADDTRESGQDLVLGIPPQIDPSRLSVGESILASADIAPDGTLSLEGLASDEHRKGADDPKATQGDLLAKKPKSTK